MIRRRPRSKEEKSQSRSGQISGKKKVFVSPRLLPKYTASSGSSNIDRYKFLANKRKQKKQNDANQQAKRKKRKTSCIALRDVAMQEQNLTALNRPITCVSTYQSSLSITCNNAIEFCFQSEFGDALGWKEFRKKLLESSDIEEKFLSERWVANHYRWIVWKQASLERKFPHVCKGEFLNPRSVLEQLKKRYKREAGDGARSALRLVLEGDSPPNRLMVLVVNNVIKIKKCSVDDTLQKENEVAPQQRGSTIRSIQMELSDGWYCIRAMFDNSVANLLENNVLQVGMKIAVQQSH